MHCPTLQELPPPPPNKTGWPWRKESPQLPATMADGSSWPAISIITPSYNQAQFIEETIRSVLLQGYPNLEYIIIDGDSADGSTEIIRKYEKWLTFWVSEPDEGQSEAINKGFVRSSGEITAWLNSDDTYQPRALGQVAQVFGHDQSKAIVHGHCNKIDENSRVTGKIKASYITFERLIRHWRIVLPQQGVFFRRKLLEKVGLLDPDQHYVMDFDLWLRISREHEFHRIEETLANFRLHPASKTTQAWPDLFFAECDRLSRPYWGPKTSWRYALLSLDYFIGVLRQRLKIRTRFLMVFNWGATDVGVDFKF